MKWLTDFDWRIVSKSEREILAGFKFEIRISKFEIQLVNCGFWLLTTRYQIKEAGSFEA